MMFKIQQLGSGHIEPMPKSFKVATVATGSTWLAQIGKLFIEPLVNSVNLLNNPRRHV